MNVVKTGPRASHASTMVHKELMQSYRVVISLKRTPMRSV